MNARATKRFWACFESLPLEIQTKARRCYRLWSDDPHHPGLHFKQIHRHQPIYSARIGIGWRALAVQEGDTFIWFWIGSHAEYDRIISTL